MKISRSVVVAVRSLDPPGRFLEKDPSSGKWFDIGDKKAVEKTSQALRDGAASLRRQLSQDLSDPDFLSAVFDSEGVQQKKPPSPVSAAAVIAKKKVPSKSHRRVKSSPSAAPSSKTKPMAKRPHRTSEVPMSPRGSRYSICVQLQGRPPQSPSPMSPRSGGESPRQYVTVVSNMKVGHRRVFSQGSVPIHSTRSGSPVYLGAPHDGRLDQPARSNSFEYTEAPEYHRPPPLRFGSPNPHNFAPHPTSPAAYPPSPYVEHRPNLPPVSPRWSPRSAGYARPGAPSLSPHLYYPSDDYQHRRRSPDSQIRPPISPRNQPYHQPRHHYPPPHYHHGSSHTLAVPSLGNESPRMHEQLPMAPSRQYVPQSPHGHATPPGAHSSSHRMQSTPVEFSPPPAFSRRTDVRPYYSPMRMEEEHMEDRSQEMRGWTGPELSYRHSQHEGAPFDEHSQASASPSAVVDVVKSDGIAKVAPDFLSLSRMNEDYDDDDEYPSDEELDPAGNRLSPLPFDREDPSSFMELPENILSLPFSLDGPHDRGMR